MSQKINYFDQSMDEIVFEKKNKSYGAFLLRGLYKKNLLKSFTLAIGVFVLSLSTPAILKGLGLIKKQEVEYLDTAVFVLHSPPSINPNEQSKPPPPKIEEVLRPTEKFLEVEAVKKKDLPEPSPAIKDLAIKIIDNKIIDTKKDDTKLFPDNSMNGGIAGEGIAWSKVEQPPEYPGGEDAYTQFMYENLDYPEFERKRSIQGTSRVHFIINQEGAVEQAKILKSSGNVHLDEEALRLIKSQPKYKPGRQNGKAVKVSCIADIEFRLK